MSKAIPITRRHFLTAGAALIAGCSPDPSEKSSPAEKNIYAILKKHRFRGQDGQPVDMEALIRANGEKYATLSTSFVGCGNGFCPLTNAKLATLGQNDRLVHYVVNLQPEFDGGFTLNNPKGNQDARDGFVNYVRAMGVKGKIIPLYPESTTDAKRLQSDAGMLTNLNDNPQDHASMIALYAPGGDGVKNADGKDIHLKNGIAEDLGDWAVLLQKVKGR